ncbi:MAG: hypothetical protein FWD86_02240 [Firmicutes bacterium]|nr:hypothetical protein [Bacillota bacterium]
MTELVKMTELIKMTEAEWLNKMDYLYSDKQYKNRFILLAVLYFTFLTITIAGFILGVHFSEKNRFMSLIFGFLMGFGGILLLIILTIISSSIYYKMSVYRHYKKKPSELNDIMNFDLLRKAVNRVGNEINKEKSFENLILTGIGVGVGLTGTGTKKWRVWKAYRELKHQKRSQTYR